jgi:hypothetical protein
LFTFPHPSRNETSVWVNSPWAVHYDLEFDLNNPHVLNEEEVWKLMVPNIFEDVEGETLVIR